MNKLFRRQIIAIINLKLLFGQDENTVGQNIFDHLMEVFLINKLK